MYHVHVDLYFNQRELRDVELEYCCDAATHCFVQVGPMRTKIIIFQFVLISELD